MVFFTAPYVIIEGAYMVRTRSPLNSVDELDRKGVRIVVGEKAAYDLFLSRTLRHAHLIRVPSTDALNSFLHEQFDAVSGVKEALAPFLPDSNRLWPSGTGV